MPSATVFIFFLALLLCGHRAGAQNAHSPAESNAISNFTARQIIEAWGWIAAQETGVAGIEISGTELESFSKGLADNLREKPAPFDLRKALPDLERLAKERRKKVVLAIAKKNEAEARKFFDALKENTNAVTLPGGIRYEVLKIGRGSRPRPEQTVRVHYIAHLIDGTEFSEAGPIDMVLVTNKSVCPGWFEALQRISQDGRMKLCVPPPLDENDARQWGIEPGSARIFEIELLDIRDTAPDDLASALAPPPRDEPLPPSGFTDRQLIEAWGWNVASQTGAAAFQLSDAEYSTFRKGFLAGVKGESPPANLEELYPETEKFIAAQREKIRLAARKKRLNEMNALFAELRNNTNVIQLPDGLRYEIVRPGDGPFPKAGQIVLVDYVGRLIDGTVFDRTDNEPLNVEVGSVIRGWNEGIQKIRKGGRIKLYIPPSLGYGEIAMSGHVAGIPPDSTLLYEIDLLDIKDSLPGPDSPGK